MDIATLANAYQDESLSPRVAVARIYDEIAAAGERPAWITLVPRENNLSRAKALETDPKTRALPLFGIPFAVKDNFDVEGLPTTAACSAYGRIPTAHSDGRAKIAGRRGNPDRQDEYGPVRDRTGRHAHTVRHLLQRFQCGLHFWRI